MSDTMVIKKATRQGVKPLIGLYSESGCGKTYSALLLARGFVGPTGKIVMVDTESGRGSLYADVLPGGYEVLELRQPFTPARYIEAIHAAEGSGAAICVLDSVSHEWEGQSGVLDMATANEERTGKSGLHNWKGPKMEHAKFMLALLQSPLPIIVCCRAKYKTRQTRGTKEMADSGAINFNQVGKTIILKDDDTTPIQADDFIFELTAHASVLKDHAIVLTKCSHPTLRDCFPKDRTEPIAVKHGEALAKWCNGAAAPTPTAQPTTTTPTTTGTVPDPLKAKKDELWGLLKPQLGGANPGWPEARQWLKAQNILSGDQTIKSLTTEQLDDVLGKTQVAIQQQQEA